MKTGQPLKTDDDLRAVVARYLFRATGDWFIGAQGSAANYQVLGDRSIYPTVGAGVHIVIKPKERMNVNLEYAQGIGDNRGIYLKLGYAW